jgi:hypothetical protein
VSTSSGNWPNISGNGIWQSCGLVCQTSTQKGSTRIHKSRRLRRYLQSSFKDCNTAVAQQPGTHRPTFLTNVLTPPPYRAKNYRQENNIRRPRIKNLDQLSPNVSKLRHIYSLHQTLKFLPIQKSHLASHEWLGCISIVRSGNRCLYL